MDWTFWVGGIVIVGLLIVTQVFLHENRWSRRPRPEQEPELSGELRDEPEPGASRPEGDADAPAGEDDPRTR